MKTAEQNKGMVFKDHTPYSVFQVGQKNWLSTCHITLKDTTRTLVPRFTGHVGLPPKHVNKNT